MHGLGISNACMRDYITHLRLQTFGNTLFILNGKRRSYINNNRNGVSNSWSTRGALTWVTRGRFGYRDGGCLECFRLDCLFRVVIY